MAPGNGGRRSRVSVGTMTETSEGEIRSTFERVLGEDVQRMQRTITARHEELDSSTGDELESVKKSVMRETHDELDVIHGEMREQDAEIARLSRELMALEAEQSDYVSIIASGLHRRASVETKILDSRTRLRMKIKVFYSWNSHMKIRAMKRRLSHIARALRARHVMGRVLAAWISHHFGVMHKLSLVEMCRRVTVQRSAESSKYVVQHATLQGELDARRREMQRQLDERALQRQLAWKSLCGKEPRF